MSWTMMTAPTYASTFASHPHHPPEPMGPPPTMKKTKLLSPHAKPWGGGVVSTPTVPTAAALAAFEAKPAPKEEPATAPPAETVASNQIPVTPAAAQKLTFGSFEEEEESPVAFRYSAPTPTTGTVERETNARRLYQRQKQIDLGKNTPGYQNYLAAFPKTNKRSSQRNRSRTPDIYAAVSKRCFDGKIKAWRRALHKWDPATTEEEKKTLEKEEEAEAQKMMGLDLREAFDQSSCDSPEARPMAMEEEEIDDFGPAAI